MYIQKIANWGQVAFYSSSAPSQIACTSNLWVKTSTNTPSPQLHSHISNSKRKKINFVINCGVFGMWSKLVTGSWIPWAEPFWSTLCRLFECTQRRFCLLFYLSKIQLSPLPWVWDGCQYLVTRDPQLLPRSGMRVGLQRRWVMEAALPSDVCPAWVVAAGRGRGRTRVGVEQLSWRRRSFLGTRARSGWMWIAWPRFKTVLVPAGSSGWSVHRSQSPWIRPA